MIRHIFIILIFLSCTTKENKTDQIDTRSYRLGVIGAFSEVVDIGIKKMALSSPMTPEEMDALESEAKKIADRNHVEIYRETDFLVTDLFPSTVTDGKHVFVIYKGQTLDEYQSLKEQKNSFIQNNEYDEKQREFIAREMAKLLSYPEERIIKLLNKEDVEIN